jgi:hypothetical protein
MAKGRGKMRATWVVLCWLVVCVLAVLGCRSPEPDLKPHNVQEVINVPPTGDARYEKPPVYPSDPTTPDGFAKRSGGQQNMMSKMGKQGQMMGAPY